MSDRTTTGRARGRLGRGAMALALIWLILTPLVLLAASAAPAGAVAAGTAPFPGTGMAFGGNSSGQLGNGTSGAGAGSSIPVPVSLPRGTGITAVAAGWAHSLALTSAGTVLSWGDNTVGQLGDGTTTSSSTPVSVRLPPGTLVTAIAANANSSLVLTSTGSVLAWGYNGDGELGDGTNTNSPLPVKVLLPQGTTVTAVAAGDYHSLAITSTGSVLGWGLNAFGELGDGSTTSSPVPVAVALPGGASITAIAGGAYHSVAVASDGTVLAWGEDNSGQLGDGATANSLVPVASLLPAGTTAVSVAAGFGHTMALTSAGSVLAWGSNFSDELGDATGVGRSTPAPVGMPAGTFVSAIAAGYHQGLALTSNGVILAWGETGTAGAPACTDCRPPTVPVPTALPLPAGTMAIAVAAGEQFGLAVVATLDHLVLAPAASAVAIGNSQTYTARGFDMFGHDLGDVTAATTFSVNGGGTCRAASCTAPPGVHIVTGTVRAARGTATLKVVTSPPTLSTAASAPVSLAGTISDTVSLTGGLRPGGTIRIQAFGPNDATCTTGAAFTATVAVAGNGSYSSPTFSPIAAGTYRFVASYSGDADNAPRPGACNESNESVVVSQATPTLVTVASGPVPAGGTVSDSATLLGAFRPSGTVTFQAFGPDDATCSRAAAFTSARPVTTAGSATSGPFAPSRSGTYRFTATYTGDVNNAAANSACGAPQESVAVAAPGATTTTQAPPVTLPPVTTAPTPTQPPPAPSSPRRPVLVAVSTTGRPFGPAGSGLNVEGRNYPSSCTTAYFFFDTTRIGSAPVDGSGRAAARGLSVPGDTGAGTHHVSSSCRASGQPVQESSVFRVTSSTVHRSAFVTSVPQPGQISLTLKSVGLSAGIAVALLALVGFPSQVFNSTLQDNYEEVRGWFRLHRPLSEVVQDLNQRVLFPVFLIIGGVLYALLTPESGLNLTSLALALGLAVAVAVTTVGFAVPTFAYFGLRWKDRGQILVLPGTIAIGAGFVLISRLLNLQPGYLYGLLAVFVFHHDVDKRTSGRLAAASALFVMVLALLAWVARVPLSGATLGPGVGFWTIVLESALCGAFVIGLESTLVGLLPLRSMDGARIKEWSRIAWGALFALSLFTLVEVLFQPGTAYVGHTSSGGRIAVGTLYLMFGVGTAAFWAYFRFRPAHEGLDSEGDHEVR